jgi:DNA-binding transcriptional LysR family regulator
MPYEFDTSILPKILGRFAEVYPQVTLEVACHLSAQLRTRYWEGEFDMVISSPTPPSMMAAAAVASRNPWSGLAAPNMMQSFAIRYHWWSLQRVASTGRE